MAPVISSAAVARVSLDDPLQDLTVGGVHRHVLVVASSRGEVVGELLLPVEGGLVTTDALRVAIESELGERLWRQQLEHAFVRATRGAPRDHGDAPSVSVVICTRDRPDQLRACLDGLSALRTEPHEIIVVDNAPTDERARELCEAYPVRYVLEPVAGLSRARNRGVVESSGEVVAFTDDDCVPDPAWLDGLQAPFADPLVMVTVGYVGPLELETRAQCVFQLYGSFARRFERTVYDGLGTSHCGLGDGNSFMRRRAFYEVGLFAENMGPGTPVRSGQDSDLFERIFLAGFRIAFEPGRIVWHRHRTDYADARRAYRDYALSLSAWTTRAVFSRRDLGGLRAWIWWWRDNLPRDLGRLIRRDERRVPFGFTLVQAAGLLLGPWALLRSRLASRKTEPIELPPPPRTPPRVAESADAPLTVAIPSHNRRDQLAAVLRGLAAQDYPADRFETIAVLDGSTDGSAEMARSLDVPYDLRVLEQENAGISASRNRGAREARSPIVVFIDDDVVPTPGFLAAHAAAHRAASDDHVALAPYPPGPRGDDTNLFSLGARQWWFDHFRRKEDPHHQWTFVDFGNGNVSFPRVVLERVGGWDERFAKGTVRREDWELGVRLLASGIGFGYYPDALAEHHYQFDFATALRNKRVEGSSDVLLATKHPHVKGHLPLVNVARAWSGEMRGRRRFFYNKPGVGRAVARPMLPLAHTFEALKLRHRWSRVVGILVENAYALGVRDALPEPERREEFLRPLLGRDDVQTVPVQLERANVVDVPVDAGRVELALRYGERVMGSMDGWESEDQWDWDQLTARATDEHWHEFRQAVLESTAAEDAEGVSTGVR
jgi:glycosyltransferase involved in cell wall biosynthesis